MSEKTDNRKRPNQVVFYATEKNLELLQGIDGNRSDFINKAIALYAQYEAKGAMYFALEKAYDYMKMSMAPEADVIRKALRLILWRRADLPSSVWASVRLSDGTSSSEAYSDARSAMMLAHENAACVGFQIYDRENKLLADAYRTETGSFAYNHLSPEAMVN